MTTSDSQRRYALGSSSWHALRALAALSLSCAALATSCAPAVAAACISDAIPGGTVAAITGETSFRLTDGREIRLAGILAPAGFSNQDSLFAALQPNQAVGLRAAGKADRFGRLPAFVYARGTEPLQMAMLDQGAALVSGEIGGNDSGGLDCVRELLAREQAARQQRRGIWTDPTAIKNAESADDISPRIGQFVVAEGKIASVREAGGTIYVNFGRRWTQGFAVVISRRIVRLFEAAGMAPKALENRIVRVRGFVEHRGGPRIEAFSPGQIELLR